MKDSQNYDPREAYLNSLSQEQFDDHIESLLEHGGIGADSTGPGNGPEVDDPLSLDSLKNNCHPDGTPSNQMVSPNQDKPEQEAPEPE